MNKRAKGSLGESLAEDFLKERGYKILHKNLTLLGIEADIIALAPDKSYVFCEVKCRANTEFGYPSEAVNSKKIAGYITFAEAYMAKHNLFDSQIRFDVIEILGEEINHIIGAFDANSSGKKYRF